MAVYRYVALLRGINVGGHHLVKMAELRTVFEELGHTHVETYLQSGNVVFRASSSKVAAVTATLEAAFAARFGFATPIVLRTRAELAAIATRHPFLAHEADHAKLHVIFVATPPPPAALAKLPASVPPDQFVVDGREAFIWYGDGAGRSKLKFDLGVPMTARNWRTVINVLAMLDA
jgi:uncharacterized protein (DUF1697 family)